MYKQISYGSRDQGTDETVKKVQQLLNKTGGYQLEEDGIFGVKTQAAVKDYQKTNNLTVDGIVGDQTWSSLLRDPAPQPAPDTGVTAPGSNDLQTETPYTPPTVQPPAYTGTAPSYSDYTHKLEVLFDAWSDREPFSYSASEDPLYQQYKDLYTHQGQLAMLDTMGQAAALTGGYSSSYAQSVGQQAFQEYMQRLNAVVPELYSAAYDRYTAQGDRMLREYTLAKDLADSTYASQRAEEESAYNRYQDAVNAANNLQNDNYNRLTALLPFGYNPTDEELSAAGMTRSQAEAVINYYKTQDTASSGTSSPSSSGGKTYNTHGYTGKEIKALQTAAGITVDGIWGPDTDQAYKWYASGKDTVGTRTAAQFKADVMTRREFSRVSDKYDSYEDYIGQMLQKWGGYMTLADIQEVAAYFKLPGWA